MRWTYEDHKQEAASREATAKKRREGLNYMQAVRRGLRAGRINR